MSSGVCEFLVFKSVTNFKVVFYLRLRDKKNAREGTVVTVVPMKKTR